MRMIPAATPIPIAAGLKALSLLVLGVENKAVHTDFWIPIVTARSVSQQELSSLPQQNGDEFRSHGVRNPISDTSAPSYSCVSFEMLWKFIQSTPSSRA